MYDRNKVADTIHEWVLKGFTHQFGEPSVPAASSDLWKAVRSTGTRLWLDTGDIEQADSLWNAEFEALTTNNTLLNKEVQKGIYDDLVAESETVIRHVAPEINERELVLEIAFVLNARHGLALVNRFDAFVSVELHTDLSDDAERTVAYGRRFHAICPERFYVKVPFSPAGLIGARALGDAGIPVNLTLGFSARQNYLASLIARPSFVNVFMGRLNAFVSDNQLGDGDNVGEKATLATQRELLTLRQSGRTTSQLIGASMRNGVQVERLAGLDVFTMPPKVAAEYRERPAEKIASRIDDDPPVSTAAGITLKGIAADTLWNVPDDFKTCVDELIGGDPDELTPSSLVSHLRRGGFENLFPEWSEHDIQTVRDDGKIPQYEHWKERLASGNTGLDGLMNLSAFHSFVADQSALDGRIVGLLNGPGAT